MDGRGALARLLGGFDHFTAGRKRLMFQTLLAELGAHPSRTPLPESLFEARGQQRWLVTEMAALKVLHAHGTGAPGLVTEEDWRALEPCSLPGPPRTATISPGSWPCWRCGSAPVRGGRPGAGAELRGWLREDGGLPFITGMDVFATATGGLALAARAPRAHPAGPRDGPGGAPERGRRLGVRPGRRAERRGRHLVLRGVPAGDGPGALRRGGGGGRAVPAGPAGRGRRVPDLRARHRLRGGDNGGGRERAGPEPAHRWAVEAAVRFVTARSEAAGPFERSWSLNESNALFRAVLAHDSFLAAVPGRPDRAEVLRARTRAVARLVDTQNADGGWGTCRPIRATRSARRTP
ncbi:hypothetical protein O1L60_11850 [Streptomyces diastatochromogenes]|nr:hypothetical protein [Streptomyces diastatochromogenes]